MTGAFGYEVGWQQPVYLPNPAAGQNWVYKADGRYYTRVLAMTFVLQTSAVVANRFPQVQLLDTNGAVITVVPAGGTVVASSQLQNYLTVHSPGLSGGSSGGSFGFIPDLLIPPGWTWQSQIFGIDPGDTITGGVLLVQQFPNDSASFTVSE
jgi:hypothetical protein